MNKKTEITNKKIYDAFKKVLQEKNYDEINVQDILNFSGVSRSTFYAHFKTKSEFFTRGEKS